MVQDNTSDLGGRQKSFQEQLQIMRQSYAARLPGKIDQVVESWKTLREAPDDVEAGRALYRMAHSLAGSGRTFGLPAVTEAARTLENLIESVTQTRQVPNDGQSAQFGTLIELLRHAALQPEAGLLSLPAQRYIPSELQNEFLTPPESPALDGSLWPLENNRLILVIGPGQQEALVEEGSGHSQEKPQLVAQLQCFGFHVQTCRDIPALGETIEHTQPSAILVQAKAEHLPDIAKTLESVQAGRDAPLPLIYLADNDELETRLQAVRAGSNEFITTPVDVSNLIGKLQTLTSRQMPAAFRALIVEDDPSLANLYAFILQQAGMRPSVALDPCQVLPILHEAAPDVILMDIHLPGCNGLELARAIRQFDAFAGVPIIFLSSDTSQQRQMVAMNLGGDLFLPKPMHPEHLVSASIAAAQRSRALRGFIVRDSLTGLNNHTATKDHLDVEFARALRTHNPLSVALLGLDNFQKINDEHGHAAGDRALKSIARLLRQLVRKTDIVGRYDGDIFAAILPEATGPDAVKVLDRIRDHFERVCHRTQQTAFCMTFSCGIATTLPSETEAEYNELSNQLIRTAEDALNQAKDQGRNRIVQIDNSP